jgi:hypothetical protein
MPMGCVDNRFTGDAHYIGGALATENFKWGTYFKVDMAGPPDPEISGKDWEKKWRRRLDATPAILERWTSHQRYESTGSADRSLWTTAASVAGVCRQRLAGSLFQRRR